MAYKYIGTCKCGEKVYGPMRAKYLGTTKTCKACRGGRGSQIEDAADRSERLYFQKFDGGWQMDVQGYISSP